jgi:hypothetical protein
MQHIQVCSALLQGVVMDAESAVQIHLSPLTQYKQASEGYCSPIALLLCHECGVLPACAGRYSIFLNSCSIEVVMISQHPLFVLLRQNWMVEVYIRNTMQGIWHAWGTARLAPAVKVYPFQTKLRAKTPCSIAIDIVYVMQSVLCCCQNWACFAAQDACFPTWAHCSGS